MEKFAQTTLEPRPAFSGQVKTAWSKKALVLAPILALLGIWHFGSPLSEFVELPAVSDVLDFGSGTSKAQCAQVAPLFPQKEYSKMEEYMQSDAFRNASIARLSGAVQIPSMSFDDLGAIGEDPRWDVFYDVAAYLEKSFPLVHEKFQLEKVNTHGLAYTWLGSDVSLKPLMLMAHQDVVPVPEDTVKSWTHPPFSGAFDGKLIWGRGSDDCKNALTGILEALEQLIAAGFAPTRTILLSFGFDEEVSGPQGAGHLAEYWLQKYGPSGIAAVVDEGAKAQTAWGKTFFIPGVAEKGYIDVEVVVRMPGGHSSIPPDHNGIGVMSEFITLVESNLYEPRLHDENPYLGLLQCGAEHGTTFPSKLKKLLSKRSSHTCSKKQDRLALEASKQSLAVKYLMTTSVAADVIRGGVKSNALPERTQATINHRVNVGESTTLVQDRLTSLAHHVAKKYNLTVHAFESDAESPSSITLSSERSLEPAPVTPTNIDPLTPYSILSGTTRALYGEDIIMSPGLMTGNTDTRYTWDLSEHIFRYAPGYDPETEGFGNIHTVNEAVSAKTHMTLIQWYSLFIRNMDEAKLA